MVALGGVASAQKSAGGATRRPQFYIQSYVLNYIQLSVKKIAICSSIPKCGKELLEFVGDLGVCRRIRRIEDKTLPATGLVSSGFVGWRSLHQSPSFYPVTEQGVFRRKG